MDRLETERLVRRRRDVHDRRVVHVLATVKGRRAHQHMHAGAGGHAVLALFDGWKEEEIRALRDGLARHGRASAKSFGSG